MKIDGINNIYDKYLDKIKTQAEKEINPELNKDIRKDYTNEINKTELVNIQISDAAKALMNTINKEGDKGFSERVEKIRQSVLSNTYRVSSEEIAEKIMEAIDMQEGRDI
jgi:anti-sigma28 factor (negative regulator of flagellin synthesis)